MYLALKCEDIISNKTELIKEIKVIKEDAEAYIQNQGKGFFSRVEYSDISADLLKDILPSYEPFEDNKEVIEINYSD